MQSLVFLTFFKEKHLGVGGARTPLVKEGLVLLIHHDAICKTDNIFIVVKFCDPTLHVHENEICSAKSKVRVICVICSK